MAHDRETRRVIIAHRANLDGPDPVRENTPAAIHECLDLGLHVEVDVWCYHGHFQLGHDYPEFEINLELLRNPRVWVHAKTPDVLAALLDVGVMKCFHHEGDPVALTPDGHLWTLQGRLLTPRSICLLPERVNAFEPGCDPALSPCAGICTDYPLRYRDLEARGHVDAL
jgi:hypothetical protein